MKKIRKFERKIKMFVYILKFFIFRFKIYNEDKKNYNANSLDFQKLYYELSDTKAQLQQANFKKDNYDRIKL